MARHGHGLLEDHPLGGLLVVCDRDEELVGDAAALAGEAGVLGEAVHQLALEGDALVGAELQLKLLAGHDGLEAARRHEGLVEERVHRPGEERIVGVVDRVGAEEGGLEHLRRGLVLEIGGEPGRGDTDLLRGVVARQRDGNRDLKRRARGAHLNGRGEEAGVLLLRS